MAGPPALRTIDPMSWLQSTLSAGRRVESQTEPHKFLWLHIIPSEKLLMISFWRVWKKPQTKFLLWSCHRNGGWLHQKKLKWGEKWLWPPCSILLKGEESTIHNSTDWWTPLPLAAASGKFLINPAPGFCTSNVTNFFLELNFTSFQKRVALIERLSESCWWIRLQQKKQEIKKMSWKKQ